MSEMGMFFRIQFQTQTCFEIASAVQVPKYLCPQKAFIYIPSA